MAMRQPRRKDMGDEWARPFARVISTRHNKQEEKGLRSPAPARLGHGPARVAALGFSLTGVTLECYPGRTIHSPPTGGKHGAAFAPPTGWIHADRASRRHRHHRDPYF